MAVIAVLAAITIMIYSNCVMIINDAKKEARRSIEARAKVLADQMYREQLANTVIHINQRMVIIEDDLENDRYGKI